MDKKLSSVFELIAEPTANNFVIESNINQYLQFQKNNNRLIEMYSTSKLIKDFYNNNKNGNRHSVPFHKLLNSESNINYKDYIKQYNKMFIKEIPLTF